MRRFPSFQVAFTLASFLIAGYPVAPAVADTSVALGWESTGDPNRPLREPSFLAVDPRGTLWVADGQHDQFQLFAPDGAFLEDWGESGAGDGQFDFVRGDELGFGAVAFDPDGTIYVADTGNHRVQAFSPNRQFLRAWGTPGRDDGQFIDPIGIAVGPDGLVYVVDDYRDDVQVFTPDGAYVRVFGSEGAGPGQVIDMGAGIAFDRAGNILVADFAGGHLERFAPDGNWLGSIGMSGSGEGQLSAPDGLAVDAEGRIYVADRGNARIAVFAEDGSFLTEWGSEGSGPNTLRDPAAIALDGEGHVYVGDVFDNHIQQFALVPPLAPR